MIKIKLIFISILVVCSVLNASDFTICSYNVGGLSDHYDYLRAASMQKLMQERYHEEPEQMSQVEKIQKLALKIIFSNSPQEQAQAKQAWEAGNCQTLFETLIGTAADKNNPNEKWFAKAESMITSYKVRPVVINDEDVRQRLLNQVQDVNRSNEIDQKDVGMFLTETYRTMAKKIFEQHINFDIICIQEATYLDSSLFPQNYEVLLADSGHSVNGIAYNKEKFVLVDVIGSVMGKAYVVILKDKQEGKTIAVASAHLTGCNPFSAAEDQETKQSDSKKGDDELRTVIQLLDSLQVDIKLIGMDSNVTAMHPRLSILKESNFKIDAENFLEPTCTNPYHVLNTRIDWIAIKSNEETSIINIPVLDVGLNNLQTNISDHKPIAAKINVDKG